MILARDLGGEGICDILLLKGMMVLCRDPSTVHGQTWQRVTTQAAIRSATFVSWCALIYMFITVMVSTMGSMVGFSDTRRRIVDGRAGRMILVAAGFLAA